MLSVVQHDGYKPMQAKAKILTLKLEPSARLSEFWCKPKSPAVGHWSASRPQPGSKPLKATQEFRV